jgi:hypothetical protein
MAETALTIESKCLHLEAQDDGKDGCQHYGAVSFPIYQTATRNVVNERAADRNKPHLQVPCNKNLIK